MKTFWIINLILFQLSWFSAAFFTQYAALIISALILLHFYLSPTPKLDIKVSLLALMGIFIDTLHLNLGTFSSEHAFFPFWLALLWMIFCISLNHSLSWCAKQPYWLLVLFGSIGGSLSYWAGIQAGALSTLQTPSHTLVVLALSWAILFPSLVQAHHYLTTRDVLGIQR